MTNLNRKIVMVASTFIYWILFLVITFVVLLPNKSIDGGLIILYLFIIPFLFIIPYRLVKPETIKTKIYYIIFGFVFPFIIIYGYLLIEFLKGFKPSF